MILANPPLEIDLAEKRPRPLVPASHPSVSATAQHRQNHTAIPLPRDFLNGLLEQLSASIGEINQPISALVLNAEAALQLLRAEPTNTGAVRQLLTCIVKDGLRTGDIVRRTRALIEKAPPLGTDLPRFGGQNALRHSEIPRKQAAR